MPGQEPGTVAFPAHDIVAFELRDTSSVICDEREIMLVSAVALVGTLLQWAQGQIRLAYGSH